MEIQKLMHNGTKANKKSLTKQKTLVVKFAEDCCHSHFHGLWNLFVSFSDCSSSITIKFW